MLGQLWKLNCSFRCLQAYGWIAFSPQNCVSPGHGFKPFMMEKDCELIRTTSTCCDGGSNMDCELHLISPEKPVCNTFGKPRSTGQPQ